uniref:MBD domain-containing protein n=1 Tax=Oryza punctata TaxID=4537 RepID=A0A0E0KNK5_ORYPU
MADSSVWRGLGKAESASIVISDDEKEEIQQDAEDVEEERPGWLPDGWIMEVYQGDDGTIYRYYTSPLSGLTFTMKSEVLHYLFSGMDERFLESKNCAADNKLIMTHEWLPNGWMIEVRAGGKNMNKMYKFYVYPPAGVRLFSKEDVLLYINKSKITGFDTNGECDTSTKDNRSAMLYVQTGKVPKRAFIQRTSVHDLYSFEKSADLVTLPQNHSFFKLAEDGDSSGDLSNSSSEVKRNKVKIEKTTCKTKKLAPLNTIKRPVGRPSKRSTKEMPCDVEIKQESASSEEYWC